MAASPVWTALIECLTTGSCRAQLSYWMRHNALLTVALIGWVASTVLYISMALEYGPAQRDIRSDDKCPPQATVVAESVEDPPPPPPKIPKVIPRPVPDGNIKSYTKDRLKSIK